MEFKKLVPACCARMPTEIIGQVAWPAQAPSSRIHRMTKYAHKQSLEVPVDIVRAAIASVPRSLFRLASSWLASAQHSSISGSPAQALQAANNLHASKFNRELILPGETGLIRCLRFKSSCIPGMGEEPRWQARTPNGRLGRNDGSKEVSQKSLYNPGCLLSCSHAG
jgi:hypothetical protein